MIREAKLLSCCGLFLVSPSTDSIRRRTNHASRHGPALKIAWCDSLLASHFLNIVFQIQ
jgi:hypothetical protein